MIERQLFDSILLDCFNQNGISASDLQKDKLFCFAEMLIECNSQFNLTAITDIEGICLKHFTDSLKVLPYIDGSNVIDIGCGGGFPVIPLAIFLPCVKFTALDSTEKKLNFVSQSAGLLGLSNVSVLCGRAEELSGGAYREKFDIAVSRAVSSMPVLAEISLGFVKVGGKLLALKGKNVLQESSESVNAVRIMGGDKQSVDLYQLKYGESADERGIITVKKTLKTPDGYPRHYSKISKHHL